MILQNIIFPSTDTCTEESMYFRRENAVEYSWCSDCIEIKKKGLVGFDTYFNSFSAEKWFKYTKVKKVFLHVRLSGCVRITLMRKEKCGDQIQVDYIGEELCSTENNEVKEFVLEFKTSSTNGCFCFELFGVGKKSAFYGGSYQADAETQHVKIAVDICTYKRESYVERNLEILRKHFLENTGSYLQDKLEVFISDNAHTLEIQKLSTKQIHIVQNKNVGGAGGFTRGMIEIKKVCEHHRITHILVMDDDIVIEPESIYRTCTLLSCLKKEYQDTFIGGAMLRLDHRFTQTESGAMWNGGEIISLKSGLDLRNLDACLFNELEEHAQFTAWWFCAFPVSVAADDNLPMPIFIRGDDVEYGLRNMKHLILMNGICVWHEPFENKYSSFLFYYILRNRLIDNALHDMNMSKPAFIAELKRQVNDELRLYRYQNAALLMRGVEDFFRGVEWLAQQDGEKLHQEIMKDGYKLQYLEDLAEPVQFLYPLYEASLHDVTPQGKTQRIINHFTVNGTYLKPLRPYNIVPTVGVCQASVYRVDKVLNYDYPSRKGFITKRDPAKCKELLKHLNKLCSRIDREYDTAVRSFAEDYRKLTTLAFWNHYLGI